MKTRINIFLLGWTLLLLAACVREPIDPTPQQAGITIPFSATVTEGTSTRASLDANTQYIFSAGDRLHVIAREGEVIKMYGCLTMSSGAGEKTATFTGELTCAEDYLPVDGTPLTATLLSAGSPEGFFTIGPDGALSGPTYPVGAVASSFAEAVSKYGVFTADGTYGAATFSLAQQSSFLLCRVRCDKGYVPAGNSVEINFYNNAGPDPVRSASVTADAAGSFSRLSFAMAFPGGSTTLSGAKLDVKWGDGTDGHKEFDDITDKTLVANNYYNVSRDAADVYPGFRIKGITNETTITFNYNYSNRGIEFSKDNGHTWTQYTEAFKLQADEEACIKGTGETYQNGTEAFIEGSKWCNVGNTPIFESSAKVYIAGDISSLFLDGALTKKYALKGAFAKKSGYVKVDIDPDDPLIFPWDELTEGCFVRMFFGCTSLTWAPAFPATQLAELCYYNMLRQTSITSYNHPFPATTLAKNCYREIFNQCSQLEAVTDDLLPATNLAEGCYRQMFYKCVKLERAPKLPATTLVPNCYQVMFSTCSKLNYIECLATTGIGENDSTKEWVISVLPGGVGTFVKSSAATTWQEGKNGIPSGWTVVDD